MNELSKLFDTYSLSARVKPAFLLFFPVVISIFTLYEQSRTWGGAAITFLISFGIITLAANLMSTQGNILQTKLFAKWGEAPTTIILRHSDSRLDSHTKIRYMAVLEKMIPNFKTITKEYEAHNSKSADEMYKTAVNYLKEHTRDSKKYPLVLKENINYGFSRNIRAFKYLGLTISLTCLLVCIFITWYEYIKDSKASALDLIFKVPFENTALIVSLILTTLLWVFFVTEKWVEVRAFSYARSLLAACENVKSNTN